MGKKVLHAKEKRRWEEEIDLHAGVLDRKRYWMIHGDTCFGAHGLVGTSVWSRIRTLIQTELGGDKRTEQSDGRKRSSDKSRRIARVTYRISVFEIPTVRFPFTRTRTPDRQQFCYMSTGWLRNISQPFFSSVGWRPIRFLRGSRVGGLLA